MDDLLSCSFDCLPQEREDEVERQVELILNRTVSEDGRADSIAPGIF